MSSAADPVARTPVLASKLPAVGTTIFSVMSALAAEHGAVNLGQGFPDFNCDPRLVQAVADAMAEGLNQYPLMAGVPVLRDAVAAKLAAEYGRSYRAADEITITAGATQAIITAILAVVRTGDEVIVLEPCYDSYGPNIELAGGTVVRVPLTPHTFGRISTGSARPSAHAPGPSSSIRPTTPAPPAGPRRKCSGCRTCWPPPMSC